MKTQVLVSALSAIQRVWWNLLQGGGLLIPDAVPVLPHHTFIPTNQSCVSGNLLPYQFQALLFSQTDAGFIHLDVVDEEDSIATKLLTKYGTLTTRSLTSMSLMGPSDSQRHQTSPDAFLPPNRAGTVSDPAWAVRRAGKGFCSGPILRLLFPELTAGPSHHIARQQFLVV